MLTVRNIAKRNFLKISLFESVKKASLEIKRAFGGCLFVFDKNKFCGLITLNELSGQDPNRLIADISIKKIQPLKISSSVEDAYNYFKTVDTISLAVIDDNDNVVGVLSKDELWSAIIKELKISYKSLEKRFSEMDVLKDLVQTLGSSLKTSSVLSKLIEALKQILPKDVNFAYVVPSPDPGRQSNLIYVHAQTPFGKKYLDLIKENLILSFDILPTAVKRRGELVKWIRGNFLFEFIEGAPSENRANHPLSSFNVPLVVRDEILGTINISSSEPNLFTEKEINLANTMVSATASTISRLRQLLESEQSRIQSLVESLSNGVIMFDLDKNVTMSNPAAQKMTGLPSGGFYLSELIKLFTGAKIADKKLSLIFEEKINKTLEVGEATHIEEANLLRFSYELVITPVRDYEKKIIGGALILHDITHIREIDRMKTEFVSVASHQLRTPLTAIKLFIEMIANEEIGKLNIKQKDYMENVQRSTERMIILINDLLNVSRIETGGLKIKLEPTNFIVFVSSVIKEVLPLASQKNCLISFSKPKYDIPTVFLDPVLMRQVVHNLITNAIKYSCEGNKKKKCNIEILLNKIKGAELNKKAKRIARFKDNEIYIFLSVLDSGIGIPKKIQSRIFEKFFRADNAIKAETDGSGLGMYVAKMIVRASGGKIWFESPPRGEKKGTIFYLSMPLKNAVK